MLNPCFIRIYNIEYNSYYVIMEENYEEIKAVR